MNYAVVTLGCKVNQFETQALEALLEAENIYPAKKGETADLVIINTCAVTGESGRKSRQAIRRIKNENPGAVCAVCGCYSQVSSELVSELGADVIHGSGSKRLFVEDIKKALSAKHELLYIDDPFSRGVFEELPAGPYSGRTRCMLKIQDGCVNFCTYCIIPYTRGRLRSLPVEACGEQSGALAAEGYKELVVTGIEISSYGRDLEPEKTLADAVEAIAENSGDMRIRLGSLEPTVITEDFCRKIRETSKVCNHFHLSLQSGCDDILSAMNRKYDSATFYEAVELLRKHFPDCGMSADLIVGFPGETREMHEQSVRFIKKCHFSSMHIFPYSPRPGTKAAKMGGQIPNSEKAERAADAQKAADEMEVAFLKSCVGKTLPVIFEAFRAGKSMGHASNYAQVCVEGRECRGVVENVKMISQIDKMLVGKVV